MASEQDDDLDHLQTLPDQTTGLQLCAERRERCRARYRGDLEANLTMDKGGKESLGG